MKEYPRKNSLVPMLMETTDNSGSSIDVAKVRIRKIGNEK